jgi:rRNA small subunit pseudouridine methyltransferase Nep1
MLSILFADTALERVPKQLWGHPTVVKRSERVGKEPRDTILIRTYHHRAMVNLENHEKRGRPDIIHFALLEALGSPLNREGLLRIYVHTVDDHIIYIDPQVRLPRNYTRFIGLIEQLYKERKVPVKGKPLLEMKRGSLSDVVSEITPSHVMAFTRRGEPKILEEAIGVLGGEEHPAVIIGAFPHGGFSRGVSELADSSVSIDPEMLDGWTVTSRVIYEYERAIRLPERRSEKMIRDRNSNR